VELSVIFDESVYVDLNEIQSWYSKQREGLDAEFLLSFEASVQKIIRNPNAYPVLIDTARAILLRRFPYRIIYKIYSEKIIVFGVFHTSRNPSLISKRLK
jgi:mRNA-degrading endonuclease RelE of RelBE toxin-antitoxin system